MKLRLSLLLFFATTFFTRAQNSISPMLCEGELPAELNQTIVDIVNKNTTNEFKKNTLLGIYDIFASGKVVYGNKSWQLVDSIGKRIISNNHLEANVKFYLLRSRFYNAFATDEGYIFATTALLANVKTEDELAFVLCHELSHYLLKHNLKNHEHTSEKLKELRKKLKKSKNKRVDAKLESLDEFLKSYYSFSQANELQADSLGLLLYINAGYSVKSISSSLNNLAFNQPLFHHHHYEPTLIEPGISFSHKNTIVDSCNFDYLLKQEDKKKYFLIDNSEEIKILKDSGYFTHPDWQIRLSRTESMLKSLKHSESEAKKISKEVEIQGISEMILTEYKSGNYFHALTYLHILEKKYPEIQDIGKMKGICLSAIYLMSQNQQKISLTEDIVDANSCLSELFFHLIAFEDFKLRHLALYYNNQGKGSNEYNRISEHYTKKILENEDHLSDFSAEDKLILRGCDRIDTVIISHPFINQIHDFVKSLENDSIDGLWSYIKNSESTYVENSTLEFPRRWNKRQRDSIILLSPNFYAIPSKKTKKYSDPLVKYDRKSYLQEQLELHGAYNNIHYSTLSFDDKSKLSTELYNQYFLMIEMIEEYARSGDDDYKCPLSLLYSEKIMKQTGCNKMQLVQMVHSQKKTFEPLMILMDAYVLPFSFLARMDLSAMVRGLFVNTSAFNIIFNLETCTIEYVSIIETNLKPDYSTISLLSQKVVSDTKKHLTK